MGEVYRACDAGLKVDVAIKILADRFQMTGSRFYVNWEQYGVQGEDRLRKSSLLGDMPAAQRGSRPVHSNKLRQRDANNQDADKGPFRLLPVPADVVIPLCPT